MVLVNVCAPGQLLGNHHFCGCGSHTRSRVVDRRRRSGHHRPIGASLCRGGVRCHRLALWAGELGRTGNVVGLVHFLSARDEGALLGVLGLLAPLSASTHPEEEQDGKEDSVCCS
jgi:hypothetical protein